MKLLNANLSKEILDSIYVDFNILLSDAISNNWDDKRIARKADRILQLYKDKNYIKKYEGLEVKDWIIKVRVYCPYIRHIVCEV